MCELHTSIVSRHLTTIGNNKILRTPPPHIISSEEILPRLTRRTLAQLRTNKSPFLKSYLYKVDANSHPSTLCLLYNTHTHDTLSPLDLTMVSSTGRPLREFRQTQNRVRQSLIIINFPHHLMLLADTVNA